MNGNHKNRRNDIKPEQWNVNVGKGRRILLSTRNCMSLVEPTITSMYTSKRRKESRKRLFTLDDSSNAFFISSYFSSSTAMVVS